MLGRSALVNTPSYRSRAAVFAVATNNKRSKPATVRADDGFWALNHTVGYGRAADRAQPWRVDVSAAHSAASNNVSVHPMHGFSQCTPNIRRVKTPYFQYAITPPIWIQFKLR
ncbi:hypothetical protein CC80DRAFT_552852 [Byssothecium circinans]|uniref:Uncharacterized protein n=1 Tax=Byssothecium circinans TaxID=147558 RepID=A0A6A5TK65_9PLEO|nr:hypothetical protein CC80DRAFT_552852 [Byssothecium circinans]